MLDSARTVRMMDHQHYLKMFDISGKTAVVTGGATGLGLAITEVLAACGANVTMLDLDRAALEREAERLKSQGLTVSGDRVDVAEPLEIEAEFARIVQQSGSLDIVFANAGVDPGPGFQTATGERPVEYSLEHYVDSRWHDTIRISLDAVFYAARAAARYMRLQKSGRIIVVTSIAALRPSPNSGVAYAAAKAGAAHVVRAFAQELAPDNILVNSLCPGPFATGMVLEALKREGASVKSMAGTPLGRIAAPDEIKGLALFLAAPASSYVTGQQFVIDGGASISAAR
jgi:NAD(P)-dependent dehydrogenase (short-subunit alcohol dehydrogenase family)